MKGSRIAYRMLLTPEQRETIRQAIDWEAEALELSVEDLKERITIVRAGWKPEFRPGGHPSGAPRQPPDSLEHAASQLNLTREHAATKPSKDE